MPDMSSLSDDLLAGLSRISAKLEHARSNGLECFGSDKHRFVLGSPLTEPAVAAFEEAHGVWLPTEYRAFLTALGHGGAGPYYGLIPLERAGAGALALPSPLRPHMTAAEMDTMSDNDLDTLENGAITLVEQGCAYSSLLIVTGPHRGAIVNTDPSFGPPYFVRDTGFLAWYERWLDELI